MYKRLNTVIFTLHHAHKFFIYSCVGSSLFFLYFSAAFMTRELILILIESDILFLYKYTHGYKIHVIGIRI